MLKLILSFLSLISPLSSLEVNSSYMYDYLDFIKVHNIGLPNYDLTKLINFTSTLLIIIKNKTIPII